MTNTELLNELISKKGVKKKYIASRLGITPQTLALKINNEAEFRQSEIDILCGILGLTSIKAIKEIFFYKVS